MLTGLRGNSQTTSTTEPNRVQIFISNSGDTSVIMSIEDAKYLLEDVLSYQYTDSLLNEYKKQDTLQNDKITFQMELINNLTTNKVNSVLIINKLERVNGNNTTLIDSLNKEIKKQKRLKILGFTGSIVLPILTLLLIN